MSNNQLDLAGKSTLELKAVVYDISKAIQNYQQILNVVNEEINKREQEAFAAQQNGQAKLDKLATPSNEAKKEASPTLKAVKKPE